MTENLTLYCQRVEFWDEAADECFRWITGAGTGQESEISRTHRWGECSVAEWLNVIDVGQGRPRQGITGVPVDGRAIPWGYLDSRRRWQFRLAPSYIECTMFVQTLCTGAPMADKRWLSFLFSLGIGIGCGSESAPRGAALDEAGDGDDQGQTQTDGGAATGDGPTLRSDVAPIRRAEDALPGVVIPPFEDCRTPLPGERGEEPDGKVCTNVAISGCTEPGKYFADYAACDVVRTQRPYSPSKPFAVPSADDPRLADPAFMAELAWVTEQVRSSGCVCCHDSNVDGTAAQWDISLGPIWTDTASDSALALFTGLADSSVLGAYPAKDNHGFDREITGLPSTDSARMHAYFVNELTRRGLSEADARAVKPFGGPIYQSKIRVPKACEPGEGLDAQGRFTWPSYGARYVYVLEADAMNPGVFPNMDLPEGTLWRLDVLADAQPLEPGVRYGETPEGTFQAFPETGVAPKLQKGKTYLFFAFYDVGLSLAGCLFDYQG